MAAPALRSLRSCSARITSKWVQGYISHNLFVLKAIGRLSWRVSLWQKPLQIIDVDIAAIEMEQAEDDAPSPVHRPPLCIALNDTFYVVLVRGRHSAPGFQFCNSRLP